MYQEWAEKKGKIKHIIIKQRVIGINYCICNTKWI